MGRAKKSRGGRRRGGAGSAAAAAVDAEVMGGAGGGARAAGARAAQAQRAARREETMRALMAPEVDGGELLEGLQSAQQNERGSALMALRILLVDAVLGDAVGRQAEVVMGLLEGGLVARLMQRLADTALGNRDLAAECLRGLLAARTTTAEIATAAAENLVQTKGALNVLAAHAHRMVDHGVAQDAVEFAENVLRIIGKVCAQSNAGNVRLRELGVLQSALALLCAERPHPQLAAPAALLLYVGLENAREPLEQLLAESDRKARLLGLVAADAAPVQARLHIADLLLHANALGIVPGQEVAPACCELLAATAHWNGEARAAQIAELRAMGIQLDMEDAALQAADAQAADAEEAADNDSEGKAAQEAIASSSDPPPPQTRSSADGHGDRSDAATRAQQATLLQEHRNTFATAQNELLSDVETWQLALEIITNAFTAPSPADDADGQQNGAAQESFGVLIEASIPAIVLESVAQVLAVLEQLCQGEVGPAQQPPQYVQTMHSLERALDRGFAAAGNIIVHAPIDLLATLDIVAMSNRLMLTLMTWADGIHSGNLKCIADLASARSAPQTGLIFMHSLMDCLTCIFRRPDAQLHHAVVTSMPDDVVQRFAAMLTSGFGDPRLLSAGADALGVLTPSDGSDVAETDHAVWTQRIQLLTTTLLGLVDHPALEVKEAALSSLVDLHATDCPLHMAVLKEFAVLQRLKDHVGPQFESQITRETEESSVRPDLLEQAQETLQTVASFVEYKEAQPSA